ncbi:MAG TPA: hypothetical protein VF904_04880 [Anaeromyxobacteraceae bacterium]
MGRDQPLIPFGLLAGLAEAASLDAALLALPALLRWRELARAARSTP